MRKRSANPAIVRPAAHDTICTDPELMRDFQTEWMAAMRGGDMARAWAINDAVLRCRDPATRDDPALPYHLRWVWDGRPFAGRHVLVRCYHGLGDTLQFARYLPVLRRHAASLTVEAQPPLLPLLASVPGPDRLVPFAPDRPLPAADCDLEIMELAYALRLPPEAVPPAGLNVTPAGPPAVGLCCTSGGWDQARDIPPALIPGLAGAVGAKPVARAGLLTLRPEATDLPVLNPGGCPARVAETAGLIAGLRLVITVDTMIAHLAGSLGRPTWLLLKQAADWRWMDQRRDSPWYPSMRLFRQADPGDWSGPLAAVITACGSPP